MCVCVCLHACVCVWPLINWPLAPLSPIVNTVHPVMYTQSVPLLVCVFVCVCRPFLGNKNLINGVQATASFCITHSDKHKNQNT